MKLVNKTTDKTCRMKVKIIPKIGNHISICFALLKNKAIVIKTKETIANMFTNPVNL